jgi:D-sedoheptulose 7-phosphate isomerase
VGKGVKDAKSAKAGEEVKGPRDVEGLEQAVAAVLDRAAAVARELADSNDLRRRVAEAAALVIESLDAGGQVLLCGNGGSAADCQHVAGELAGRFLLQRKGLAAVALTTDSAVMTSVANDYGFEDVFRRQVEAVGREGDILLAYSTSGNSANCIRAVEQAREMGIRTVALTGRSGGAIAKVAQLVLRAPSDSTPRIQECHEKIGHALCNVVERAFGGRE